MGGKQAVEIERLLRWAYCDELPKRETSSAEGIWDAIAEYGARGGIDPGHGAAQRYPHFGVPHPDALAIEVAVSALPDAVLDWASEAEAILGPLLALADPRPLGSSPRPEARARKPASARWWGWERYRPGVSGYRKGLQTQSAAFERGRWQQGDVTGARDVILVKSLRTAALVTMHAKRGTRPDWHEEPPRAVPVYADSAPSRPVLIGECRAKNVYSTGSYCPLRWSPSPIAIAELRADYLAWWRGLKALAAMLELDAYQAVPPSAPEMPWREREVKGQLFSVGSKKTAAPLLLKPQRGTMRAPLRPMPEVPRPRHRKLPPKPKPTAPAPVTSD